ncbi:MAG: T9SS type A sorting domain-containing protein [Candidatus Kapaibacterium sp.]
MKKSFLLSVVTGGVMLGATIAAHGQLTQRVPVPTTHTLPIASPSQNTIPRVINVSPDVSIPRAPLSGSVVSKTKKNGASTSKALAKPPGVNIGYTYYDFQTNASMEERLVYSVDPSDPNSKYVQMLWMASLDSSKGASTGLLDAVGFNDQRGAHYALIDVASPDAPESVLGSWKKMAAEKTGSGAPERRGWPSIVKFKDGTIGTATHSPVDFFANTSFGGEDFKRYTADNGSTTSTWPRAAVDGKDNVHLIYTFSVTSGEVQTVYRRSTDKGKTWSAEKIFTGPAFDAPSGQQYSSGAGGDTYAIAARDNNVVVMYGDRSLRILYRKSTDNGETWSAPRIVFDPQHTDLDTTAIAGTDSVLIKTDTVLSCGQMMDVILDSEGNAHFVFNQMLTYVERKAVKSADTLVAAGGTIYDISELASYATLGMSYYKENDQFIYYIAKPSGTRWDGSGQVVSRRRYSGLSRYPQLGLDSEDNLYMVYTSVTNGDTKPVMIDNSSPADGIADIQVDGLVGHIYATHRLKNNTNWSAPNDLTPTGIDCLFGTLCNEVVNGRMYIGYSADDIPGDRVTNTELPTEQTGIYMYAYDIAKLNQVGVDDEKASTEVLQLQALPNPTNGTTVFTFAVPESGNATLTLYNSLGMNVATLYRGFVSAGNSSVTFDTASLPSGAYYSTLEINGHKLTKMVSVVK